jgi:hypothetical protein
MLNNHSLNLKDQRPYLLGMALLSVISGGWLLQISIPPTGGKISPVWLTLVILFFAVGVLTAWMAYSSKWNSDNFSRFIQSMDRNGTIYWAALVSYVLLGLLLYPSEQFTAFPSLFLRAKTLFLWGLGVTGLFIIHHLVNSGAISARFWSDRMPFCRVKFVPFLLASGLLLALAAFIFISRIGIRADLYWKVAGIPLLPMQLYSAVGCVLLYSLIVEKWLPARFPNSKLKPEWITAAIFVLIWVGAAFCWNSTPQARSVFATGPYPPSNVMYPHSDAAVHDSGAAMIEIGLPVNGGQFTDKPAYMFFLGIIHLLVGDDIQRIVLVQVMFLALLPAILFLLGRELHSPKAGLLLAVIVVYRAVNAIQAVTAITTASVKELMSETPLALALALLCLIVIRYWKSRSAAKYPILLGGVYGIALLIRPHPIFFFPILVLFVIWLGWKNFPRLAGHLTLFAVTLALVLVPISISNIQQGRIPDYLEKINIILHLRSEQAQAPQTTLDEDQQLPATQSGKATDQPYASDVTPVPQAASTPEPAAPVVLTQPSNDQYPVIQNRVVRLMSHALHNELAILLSMPSSVIFHDLPATLQAAYWDEGGPWNGFLTPGQWIALLINLLILAVGFSAFFSRTRWFGLFPLVIQISINLANSFARSSGGRFLTPVDWIIYLYYAVGIVELIRSLLNDTAVDPLDMVESRPRARTFGLSTAAPLLIFAVIGLALGYIQVIIPDRYIHIVDPVEFIRNSTPAEFSSKMLPGIQTTIAQTRTSWYYGKALYPRYYSADQGEPSPNSEMHTLPYNRVVFEMIGPDGNNFVLLPSTTRGKKLQNGADVLLFGCRRDENTIDGWLVVINPTSSPVVLKRDPQQPYTCP